VPSGRLPQAGHGNAADRTSTRRKSNTRPPQIERQALAVIDEIQRVPELLLAIKASVDEDPRAGRYLLTGSSRLFGMVATRRLTSTRSVDRKPGDSSPHVTVRRPNAVAPFRVPAGTSARWSMPSMRG